MNQQDPPTLTPTAVLACGLSYIGFGERRQKCRKELSERRFRAHYGVGSRAIAALIANIRHFQPRPGVSFEVVTDPIDGKIRWINGPEPASIHDITFLRGGKKHDMKNWKRLALYFHVPANMKLVGDSAYEGQADKVSITKDAHSPATKALFARMKSMMETCFGRLKNFRILTESFRHGTNTADKLNKVKMAFEAAAVLVQYDCENGHPLFEP